MAKGPREQQSPPARETKSATCPRRSAIIVTSLGIWPRIVDPNQRLRVAAKEREPLGEGTEAQMASGISVSESILLEKKNGHLKKTSKKMSLKLRAPAVAAVSSSAGMVSEAA